MRRLPLGPQHRHVVEMRVPHAPRGQVHHRHAVAAARAQAPRGLMRASICIYARLHALAGRMGLEADGNESLMAEGQDLHSERGVDRPEEWSIEKCRSSQPSEGEALIRVARTQEGHLEGRNSEGFFNVEPFLDVDWPTWRISETGQLGAISTGRWIARLANDGAENDNVKVNLEWDFTWEEWSSLIRRNALHDEWTGNAVDLEVGLSAREDAAMSRSGFGTSWNSRSERISRLGSSTRGACVMGRSGFGTSWNSQSGRAGN